MLVIDICLWWIVCLWGKKLFSNQNANKEKGGMKYENP